MESPCECSIALPDFISYGVKEEGETIVGHQKVCYMAALCVSVEEKEGWERDSCEIWNKIWERCGQVDEEWSDNTIKCERLF